MAKWDALTLEDQMANSLALAVVTAEETARGLRDLQELEAAAQRLLERVNQVGCTRLVAASRDAEPLVTAATLLGGGLVSMQSSADGADKLVLVGAATVTGAAARETAQRLRAEGASWICAVVYDRVRPDLDGLDDDGLFDQVESLDRLHIA